MSYANAGDVIIRYKELNKLGGASEINSAYVHYAEFTLDSMLGNYFTVPFSNNNITAKDLTVDLVYLRYYEGIDSEKASKKREIIQTKIDNLIVGKTSMVTDSSDLLTSTGDPVYSNTDGFHNIFGHGPIEDLYIDHDLLDEEADERG